MIKKKMITLVIVGLTAMLLVFTISANYIISAKADVVETKESVAGELINEQAARGLFTMISLTIGGEASQVKAVAHNDFTLGDSVIPAYVELYSSYSYQSSYTTMNFEGSNYTSDLNIYESLELRLPTNGETKYWKARVRYKFDNDDWVSKSTDTLLFDGDGKIIR